MYQLFSPNGTHIQGTKEQLTGKAVIGYVEGRNPDGTFNFEYVGETVVWWDEQRTVERDGKRIFVDETGDEFTEDQLELREGEWINDEFMEDDPELRDGQDGV